MHNMKKQNLDQRTSGKGIGEKQENMDDSGGEKEK